MALVKNIYDKRNPNNNDMEYLNMIFLYLFSKYYNGDVIDTNLKIVNKEDINEEIFISKDKEAIDIVEICLQLINKESIKLNNTFIESIKENETNSFFDISNFLNKFDVLKIKEIRDIIENFDKIDLIVSDNIADNTIKLICNSENFAKISLSLLLEVY